MKIKWVSVSSENMMQGKESRKEIVHSDYQRNRQSREGEIQIRYQMQGYWEQEADNGDKILCIPGGDFTKQVGAPMLAQEGLLVAIPPGAKIKAVEVLEQKQRILQGTTVIPPVPMPALETETASWEKDSEIYNSEKRYPSKCVTDTGVEWFMGVCCLHLMICPMQYIPKRQEVTLLTEIIIRIAYEGGENSDELVTFRGNQKMQKFVLGAPGKAVTNEKPRMIIIVSDIFTGCMNRYKEQRSSQYDIEEITLGDVKGKYSGKEAPEAIRSYLLDKHKEKPLHTVILGGASNEIPSYGGYGFQSDSYYGKGEEAEDYKPLFAVSRFPAVTGTELRRMTEYAGKYNDFKKDCQKHAVFIAYNENEYINCSDEIIAEITGDYRVDKRYEGSCSRIDVVRSIKEGCGFINYRGHGSVEQWSTTNTPLNSQIPTLNVGDKAPHVFSIACRTNGIESSRCFGIVWTKNLKAISFLGASRDSYRHVNNNFDRYIWEEIQKDPYQTIGEVYQIASCRVQINDHSEFAKTNLKQYLLLGDATAKIGIP